MTRIRTECSKTQRRKRISLLFLCLFTLFPFWALSQTSTNAAGGNATGANGSVSSSFGQIFYNQGIGNNGSILEGVQQPYEIYEVNIEDLAGIELNCSVYPNPASDFLELKINNEELIMKGTLHYMLFDINGKVLKKSPISESETTIPMNEYSKQSCFLTVYEQKHTVKTFKIIKR